MTDFSIASLAPAISIEEANDSSFKTIVIFSCVGLLASVCLMTFGIDISVVGLI